MLNLCKKSSLLFYIRRLLTDDSFFAAHNSAGPKMDIVLEEDDQQTGFLAQDIGEYAEAILKVIKMPESERLKMAAAARKRAGRFSEERFYHDFKAAVRPVLC